MKKMLAWAILAAFFCALFMAGFRIMQQKGYGFAETFLVFFAAVAITLVIWWAIGEVSR